MIAKLLALKEKFKMIYAKAGIYLKHITFFLLAFISFFVIGRQLGYNEILANPFICIAAALLCAFLPINATAVIAVIFMIVHLFSFSIELAVIALIVMVIVFLLYFRFSPKTGILMIITPILFYLKMPYLIPVIVGLTFGMSGIIPVISGTFIYYLMDFSSEYSTAVATLDADDALQNINFIINNVLTNKELIIVIAAFSVVIMCIYLLKRLSVKNSWLIAVISGSVLDMLVLIIAFHVSAIEYNILMLIIGHIIAIAVGLLMSLFIFSVDYSATEYVQFEDNDYYYYVKAVPKIVVTSKDVTIKKINSRNTGRSSVHMESFDENSEE